MELDGLSRWRFLLFWLVEPRIKIWTWCSTWPRVILWNFFFFLNSELDGLCPRPSIYNSLILPQLTYGILVWGYESNCIFKLQKMALRAMTSSKYNAHTNPLFKKMHLLKVGDIHTVQQLKFFYKLTQNNLPAYFNSFLIRRQHNIHELLTRNRHMLVTEKVHHKFAEKSIRYSVFKTVNDTPTQIIDKMYTHSLQGVANYSKNLLINEYDVRCCIRDCYICK